MHSEHPVRASLPDLGLPDPADASVQLPPPAADRVIARSTAPRRSLYRMPGGELPPEGRGSAWRPSPRGRCRDGYENDVRTRVTSLHACLKSPTTAAKVAPSS